MKKQAQKPTKRKVQPSKSATTKAKSTQKPQKRQSSKTVYQDKSVLVKKTASGIVIYSK